MFNAILYKNYGRNIFNYKNLYPITSSSILTNKLFYNVNYKEIVYNPNSDSSSVSTSSSTYTMPSYSITLYVTASSNSITITLPTAVNITGVNYTIIRTDTTLTNAITINTTSSQTIGGSGTSRKMYTANEVWHIISDGANWQILNHTAKTEIANYGAITFTTTGTAPGIPTATYHKLQWQRNGKFIYIYYGITPTNTPTVGTGDYLFPFLPTALSGLTIDTSVNPSNNVASPGAGGSIWTNSNMLLLSNTAHSLTGGYNVYGFLNVYSAYYVRSFQIVTRSDVNSSGVSGPSYFTMNNVAGSRFTASGIIPITEFDP